MSLATTTEWDVRTTGDNSNGGGFDTSSSGTDYSQQDSAHVSYSDLAISPTNNKQLTSSAHSFSSDLVGNLINITSGSGFTIGFYQVVSVSGGVATMDRAVGTAGSSGGVGKLGGALADTNGIAGSTVGLGNANTVWIKTGTYSITISFHINNSYAIIGYGSTHGDNGSPPTLNVTANNTPIVNGWGGGTSILHNLILTTSASTKTHAIGGSASLVVVSQCSITGFVNGISQGINSAIVRNSYIYGCTGYGVDASGPTIVDSVISGNGMTQVHISGSSTIAATIHRALIIDGSSAAIQCTGGSNLTVTESTIANNSGDAISLQSTGAPSSIFISSNIIYGNSGFGLKNNGTDAEGAISISNLNNAFGANTSGNQRVPSGSGNVTLTADPFTNSGSGDYSLNNTSGGGAACKGVGYPGAFADGTTTGTPDIGAVQSGSGGGGGGTTEANYCFVG